MSRKVNIIFFCLWLAILLACLLTFQGCTATKNQKAVDRVRTNRELLEQVGRQWEKSNPCTVDSIRTVKSDTVIKVDTVTSEVWDTVTQKEVVAGPTRTLYKTITRTVIIKDSVKIEQTDLRRLGICIDSVNFYKGVIQQRNGQVSALKEEVKQAKEEVKEAKASRRHWILSFWILLIVAGAWITRRLWLPLFGKIL